MNETGTSRPLLALRGISVHFPARPAALFRQPRFRVLDRVSLALHAGEMFCLIGESGSGKTTLMNVILGLCPFQEGKISFRGQPVAPGHGPGRNLLNKQCQVIFQEPVASLSPFRTLGQSIMEPLQAEGIGRKKREEIIRRLCRDLDIPATLLQRRPAQVSVGQAQRVCIARSLATDPDLLLLDEPMSALDNLARQETAALLCQLQKDRGLTCLLISHDLALISKIATTVAVIYLGRIVEQAPAESFFTHPCHPYSHALLSSALHPGLWSGKRIILNGEIPSPRQRPSGCPFHPRCPSVFSRCTDTEPPTRHVQENHVFSCHLQHRQIQQYPC